MFAQQRLYAFLLTGSMGDAEWRGVDNPLPPPVNLDERQKWWPMESGTQMEQKSDGGNLAVRHRDRGVLAIGVWKLVEAVFFFLVGVGVIHFLHRDLGDAVTQLAERLHIDIGGRIMTWVLGHLDDVTAHRLKQVGAWTFVLAGVRVVEGVGLVMEKVWAEYLTVSVTISFLPWELYEIVRKGDWMRVGLLVVNLLVLAYLVWQLRRRRRAASQQP